MRYTSTGYPGDRASSPHFINPASDSTAFQSTAIDSTARHRSMLELEHIHKSFEGRAVLTDVSLSIPHGATHALIGSSGSGKTTLLRITLGLIPFDKGYVKINDQALLSFTPVEWADRIGYVPQDGGLFPHISAKSNIALIARLRGWRKSRIDDRVEELRKLVDLDPEIL